MSSIIGLIDQFVMSNNSDLMAYSSDPVKFGKLSNSIRVIELYAHSLIAIRLVWTISNTCAWRWYIPIIILVSSKYLIPFITQISLNG